MKRVAIYLRVSTSKQDIDNQRRELEAVAERSGWDVLKIYEDAGISGAKGRDNASITTRTRAPASPSSQSAPPIVGVAAGATMRL
jgi:hypothetical protein